MEQRGKLMSAVAVLLWAFSWGSIESTAQEAPVAAFTSSVDLVRVTAIVRDRKGRFVGDLTKRDFEILDGGVRRPISDFRPDLSGVSVALLFDVSGSMEGMMGQARESAGHLLSWLESGRDEGAVFTFDTRLDEVAAFTTDLAALPARLEYREAVRRDVSARRDRASRRAREHARGAPSRRDRLHRRQRQRSAG